MAILASNALTTLADVKESLGISSSDTSKDNLCIRKINQVSSQIENYCDRTFALTDYIEYYDGSNIDSMVLKQRPIVSDVSHSFSIELRDTSLNQNNFETITSDLYFTDTNSGVIELDYISRGHWDRYRVTYSAGYSTIPVDLAEAASTLAAYYVNNPAGRAVGVALHKEGQRETRYGNNNSLLTFRNIMEQLGVDQIIDSYSNLPVLTDR